MITQKLHQLDVMAIKHITAIQQSFLLDLYCHGFIGISLQR